MNANKIEARKVYEVTVGKNKTTMLVLKVERRVNGQLVFVCQNIKTKTQMTVADAKRFLREIKTGKTATVTKTERAATTRPDGTVSGLQAAYLVLKEAAEPLTIRQIMERIDEQGLANLSGKTPAATVSAAMQREISTKAGDSRFTKSGKGLFAVR
jgi:hypothetical protein